MTDPDPAVASIGHQVVGIVERDVGNTDVALAHLRRALALARRADVAREADARGHPGQPRWSSSVARATASPTSTAPPGRAQGLDLARVLVRRAIVVSFRLERFEDGAADLRRALAILDRYRRRHLASPGAPPAGLDARRARGHRRGARGVRGGVCGSTTDLDLRSDVAAGIHNQGWIAFLEGDLPLALERYAEASERYSAVDETSVDLVYDQCSAYLVAGMPVDALDVVEQALVARPLLEVEEADLLLALAEAALAADDHGRASRQPTGRAGCSARKVVARTGSGRS